MVTLQAKLARLRKQKRLLERRGVEMVRRGLENLDELEKEDRRAEGGRLAMGPTQAGEQDFVWDFSQITDLDVSGPYSAGHEQQGMGHSLEYFGDVAQLRIEHGAG